MKNLIVVYALAVINPKICNDNDCYREGVHLHFVIDIKVEFYFIII